MDFLSANLFLETTFLAHVPDENDEPTDVWAMEFRDRPVFRDDGPLQEPEVGIQAKKEERTNSLAIGEEEADT
jgi:hypothetical protein